MTAHAGYYGPEILLDAGGRPLRLINVVILQADGTTPAVLYTDRTKAVTAPSNAVQTDSGGNLAFYADPGQYVLRWTVAGVTHTLTVEIGQDFSDQGGAVQSVNGRTGAVVLTAGDVGADPSGAAASAVTTHAAATDPHGDRAYTDTQVASRATAAALTTETARATAAEQTNATAIATETTRAQAAEAAISAGLQFKAARVVATSNVASRSGLATIDGITLSAGDLVLLVAQSSGSQNGLWRAASGAWTRPTNYATGSDATAVSVWIEDGTANKSSVWVVAGSPPNVVDTNVTSWQQASGLGEVIAGTGIVKTGNTLSTDPAVVATVVGAQLVVVHGATAGTARPTGATVVHWIGSVAPTNAATNDEWTDTANKIVKRWNGSSFDSLGSAAYEVLPPTSLNRLAATLGSRESGKSRILWIGDSHVEGQGASSRANSMVYRVADRLRTALGYPASGSGYIPAWTAGESSFTYPWTKSAGASYVNFVTPGRGLQLPPGETGTITFTGDAFTLLYKRNSGNNYLDVTLDGVTTSKAIDTGTGSGQAFYTVTGLANVSHTITVTSTTGGNGGRGSNAYLGGIYTYNGDYTSGLEMYEAGMYGADSKLWAVDIGTGWADGVTAIAPDAVFITLGANDQNYGGNAGTYHTPAQFEAWVQTLIATIRAKAANAPVVLVAAPARDMSGSPAGYASWSAFVAAMTDIAAQDSLVTVVDLTPQLGQVLGDTLSLYADNTHMNNKGHGFAADVVTSRLTRLVRGQVGTDPDTIYARANAVPANGAGASGLYIGPSGTSGTGAFANGSLRAAPLFLSKKMTFTGIGVEITTSGSAGALTRMGIYADNNGFPGALILDAGTIDGTQAPGGYTITFGTPLTLKPGTYWLAQVNQGAPTTTPTTRLLTACWLPMAMALVTSGTATGFTHSTSTTAALPATWAGSTGASSAPRICLQIQ